jgi:hypothetical protein
MNYLILSIILCSLSFQARASEPLDVHTALERLRLEKTIGTLTLDQVSTYYDLLREMKYLTNMDELSIGRIVELNKLLNAEIKRSVDAGKIIMRFTIEGMYFVTRLTENTNTQESDETVSLTFAERLSL